MARCGPYLFKSCFAASWDLQRWRNIKNKGPFSYTVSSIHGILSIHPHAKAMSLFNVAHILYSRARCQSSYFLTAKLSGLFQTSIAIQHHIFDQRTLEKGGVCNPHLQDTRERSCILANLSCGKAWLTLGPRASIERTGKFD